MTEAIHLIPLAFAGLSWVGLHSANARLRWFRIGELIFWDAILLVLVYLAWLHWF